MSFPFYFPFHSGMSLFLNVCSVCRLCSLSFGSFLELVVEISCFLPMVSRLEPNASHMLSKCSAPGLLSSPGDENNLFFLAA